MTDILTKSFIVDTNILVYLFDEGSEFNASTGEFFDWAEINKITLVVADQNILELTSTLGKDYNLSIQDAKGRVQKLLAGREFAIISPLPTTLPRYNELTEAKGLKRGNIFDYYLAATALDNGVNSIITNNKKDFEKIKSLEAFDFEDIKKLMS